jgi:hypothetical protein
MLRNNLNFNYFKIFYFLKFKFFIMENGDWGLGIGQSPIPNPQSPIPILIFKIIL